MSTDKSSYDTYGKVFTSAPKKSAEQRNTVAPLPEVVPPTPTRKRRMVEAVDVASLDMQMPKLTVKRKGGKRKDLLPEAQPKFAEQDPNKPKRYRLGKDYTLAYYQSDSGTVPEDAEELDSLTKAGKYVVLVTGISDRLTGQATVPFQVKRSKKPLAALLAALLLVGGVLVGMYLTGNGPWYDPNAGEGLAGINDEDLQAILDAKVEAGMMNVTILTPVKFENGSTEPGEVGFNNIAQNHVDQKLTITLKDTGEVLYESGAIAPDHNIQYITLNRELDPGVYAATATVTGYDTETHEQTGAMGVELTIVVSG